MGVSVGVSVGVGVGEQGQRVVGVENDKHTVKLRKGLYEPDCEDKQLFCIIQKNGCDNGKIALL
ncbi:MAG: hypothetical protein JXB19_05935 [Bacteroidales bacterium]|nr:hypothetical protein [Bacteroidales bacterium]